MTQNLQFYSSEVCQLSLREGFAYLGAHCLAQLSCGSGTAQVWCTDLPHRQHLLNGMHERCSGLVLTKVIEHKLPGPDRGDRIGNTFACDIGGRAVNGLKEAWVAPLRIEVRARSQAETARDSCTEISEDIPKEVGG